MYAVQNSILLKTNTFMKITVFWDPFENFVYCIKCISQVLFTPFIGYVTHEAVVWSDVHNRWFFLPRRCSKDSYNDVFDETRGCNVMITADDTFTNIKVHHFLHSS
jgi:soluble calcium-activated nucleotidase 1